MQRIRPDAVRRAQWLARNPPELTAEEERLLELKRDAEADEAAEREELERDYGDA